MKRFVFVILMCVTCNVVQAGLVVTKAGKVTFGEVSEKKEAVWVALKFGDAVGKVQYKKSAVFWFSTNKLVTNHYLAALEAYKKKSYPAAKFLAKLAIKYEPKNKAKATELLAYIKGLKKIPDPVEENKKKIIDE